VTPARVLSCETLTGPDLKAFNTFEQPRRVAPQRLDAPAAGARMTFKLPPRSYTVAQIAVRFVERHPPRGYRFTLISAVSPLMSICVPTAWRGPPAARECTRPAHRTPATASRA
jgi:hypothetical protein